jgi:hypothetical protein
MGRNVHGIQTPIAEEFVVVRHDDDCTLRQSHHALEQLETGFCFLGRWLFIATTVMTCERIFCGDSRWSMRPTERDRRVSGIRA